jgi:dTDP-glucose pyrophosphorylase
MRKILNQNEELWRRAIFPANASMLDVIQNLDLVAIKIVLITAENGKLLGTISDGDIRRGLLKGLGLNSSIDSVIQQNPLVVLPEMSRDWVMKLMVANKVQQIPIVDDNHHLVGLHLWDIIATPPVRYNQMVIMAGGMGTRLRPFTEECPKPLLPVAGKPMLEHIIERAKSEGFSRFLLAIHYKGQMIEDHFGNGDSFDVQIDYLREKFPLGTAGALGLIKPIPDLPFIVTNGDVISDIQYGELLDFHSRQNAIATMAVRLHEWQHPFGVVQMRGVEIVGFEEKPVARSHINAGIYVLQPDALSSLGQDEHCDMPTLFQRLQAEEKCIVGYPMHEPWIDVGRPDDLNRANEVN